MNRPHASGAAPGTRVGQYLLLTKIGEGGMGVVHLAQTADGRRVALKVLRPQIVGDDEARERLAREVASLRRVRSPRVAEILDADPWGETPYVATRYVPGLSLHQHLRDEGPIDGGDLTWFAAGLAEAVIAVHTVGVLHRDIKPSNVLLEGRSPVLIDFGLARVAEDPRLTRTGWLLGTPGYLAPEIMYGDSATPASDAHSWAATVVFAATGRPPYGTGPAMAIMDRVRRGEHDLSGVPDTVRPLLEKALAPEPGDRPELAAVLSTLRGPSASGSPTGPVPLDQPTMPVAVFSGGAADTDRTQTIGDDAPTDAFASEAPTDAFASEAPTARQPTAPARPVPVPVPTGLPARTPYMQPSPPAVGPRPVGRGYPAAWQPPPTGTPKMQRGALLAGLFLLVAFAFARAPYLTVLGLTLTALVVRTFSWTSQSARDRRYRRGRPKWYDGPVAAATSPWYLVVATGGTLMLVMWSVFVAAVVGLAYSLFGLPLVPGLLLMGGVLAVSLWWGPGSRRLRVPARQLVVAATRDQTAAWATIAVLAVALLVVGAALTHGAVDWAPAPGPPWRSGTVLGTVLHWFS